MKGMYHLVVSDILVRCLTPFPNSNLHFMSSARSFLDIDALDFSCNLVRKGSEFTAWGPEVFRGPSFSPIHKGGQFFHTPAGGLVFSRHVFLKSV